MATRKVLYVDSNGDYVESAGVYEVADHINVSAGAGDAGKPIVLDAGGLIDGSMIDDSDIDHGSIGGLGDDDHTQYHNDTRGDARYHTQTELASVSNGEGASLIGIEDASAYYAGANLEAIFDELEGQLGGDTSSTYAFAEDNVVADDDAVYAAINKLDLKWGDLSSTANGEGASLVSIEDSGSLFTATTVEGALAELANDSNGVSYTVGTGGVTIGDLVYISGNDIVVDMDDITAGEYGIGLALSTEVATGSVVVARNDTVVGGILTGATAGNKYWWNGSAHVSTVPATSGQYVWQTGVAKNATDLHAEVSFVKKNI